MFGFLGQDTGATKLDVVTHVYVLHHGSFLWMIMSSKCNKQSVEI